MDIEERYRLSTYQEITVLSNSTSKKISIVKNEVTDKLYVKKVLPSMDYFNFYVRFSTLKHMNLSEIQDVIGCDGVTYVFEEYINGQTLYALLENEGIPPENKVIDYIMQVCDALIYLHEQDPPIIHRDIKPENIMVSAGGVIKLVDFDIAREFKQSAKRDTVFMGTKEYAAPEQYGFKQTDARTDIYAIGVLLYEMLTGKLPQNNITYKGALQKIIKKCLRLEPEQRYQSVSALKKALADIRENGHKKRVIYALSGIAIVAAIVLFYPTISDYLYSQDQAVISSWSIDDTTKENDTIIITSEDGNFTAVIPSDWEEVTDYSLNEEGDLQALKRRNGGQESRFILLASNKSDLAYNSFEEWKELMLATFLDFFESTEIGEENIIYIESHPAIQQVLSGVSDKIKYKYLLTYIDGNHFYGQVICETTESYYEKSLRAFESMTHSIKGL